MIRSFVAASPCPVMSGPRAAAARVKSPLRTPPRRLFSGSAGASFHAPPGEAQCGVVAMVPWTLMPCAAASPTIRSSRVSAAPPRTPSPPDSIFAHSTGMRMKSMPSTAASAISRLTSASETCQSKGAWELTPRWGLASVELVTAAVGDELAGSDEPDALNATTTTRSVLLTSASTTA